MKNNKDNVKRPEMIECDCHQECCCLEYNQGLSKGLRYHDHVLSRLPSESDLVNALYIWHTYTINVDLPESIHKLITEALEDKEGE